LLSILFLLSILITPAAAASVDVSRTGSITATMTHNGRRVPGGTLTIYRVAEISGSSYRLVEPYTGAEVSLEDIDSPSTAEALAAYTLENNIEGITQQIGSNGRVTFSNLQTGLYLVMQHEAPDGFYPLSPFLVSIPQRFLGKYIYDVSATPKLDLEPEDPTCPSWPTCPDPSWPTCPDPSWPTCPDPSWPTCPDPSWPTCPDPTWPTCPDPSWPTCPDPSWPTCPTEPDETTEPTEPGETTEPEETTEPTEPGETTEPDETTQPTEPEETDPTKPTEPDEPTEPDKPKLPQTGQLNWPVPVLAVCGIFLTVVGWYLNAAEKKKANEE